MSCNRSHFSFIISLIEEGGTAFSFGKVCAKCNIKSAMQVHDPQFYWKVSLLSYSRIDGSLVLSVLYLLRQISCEL
jgi:hypothetical protein